MAACVPSIEQSLGPKLFPRRWFSLSEHSKIPISIVVFRDQGRPFWLLGITWETESTSRELSLGPKLFPRRWFSLSEHSKIPISIVGFRDQGRLFWLLGITWEMESTSRELSLGPWSKENPSQNEAHNCTHEAPLCVPSERARSSMQNLAYTQASVYPLCAVV